MSNPTNDIDLSEGFGFAEPDPYSSRPAEPEEETIHSLGTVDFFTIERYLEGFLYGKRVSKTVEISVPIDAYNVRQEDGSWRLWLTVAEEYEDAWEAISALGDLGYLPPESR